MDSEASVISEFVSMLVSLNHPTYLEDGRQIQWPLEIMRDFNDFLNKPVQNLNCIHVAGTNGKGSCCNILAALLTTLGYQVGVYGSPHLLDVRERVKINGELIDEKSINAFMRLVKSYSQGKRLPRGVLAFNSYSEVLVSLAFFYFSRKKVDYAVIETGIGGELDPTNIIEKPLLSIISSIGYDHTDLFGNDLKAITKAKCGIIKPGVPVVVGHVNEDLRQLFKDQARCKNAPIFFSDELYNYLPYNFKFDPNLVSDLGGAYQHLNFQTICCAAYVLHRTKGFLTTINRDAINYSFGHASSISNFHGRWETLCEHPRVIVDVSGNALGLSYVFKQLISLYTSGHYSRLVIILGLSSKGKLNIKQLLPKDAVYYYTEAYSFISAEELADSIGISGTICESVESAIRTYLETYNPNDLLFIGGHIWVAAEGLRCKHLFEGL